MQQDRRVHSQLSRLRRWKSRDDPGSGTYKGSVREQPDAFELDGHHFIERGKVFPVCGNTWRMLADTRFRPHFGFIGDFSTHYGIFPGCGTSIPFAAGGPQEARGSCC